MEILYVTTMAAIFVLCLALLFTARRILQSSPLSSGDLALSRIYEPQVLEDVAQPMEETAAESFKQSVRARLDSVISGPLGKERVEPDPIMASWVASPLTTTVRMFEPVVAASDDPEAFVSDRIASHTFLADIIDSAPVAAELAMAGAPTSQPAEQPTPASSIHAAVSDSAEEVVDEGPRKEKRRRSRKPLPSGYNYALECLLLGVSVLVLVTTQRGTLRNRSLQSSQHRVA